MPEYEHSQNGSAMQLQFPEMANDPSAAFVKTPADRVSAYYLAKQVADQPARIISLLLYAAIIYWMVRGMRLLVSAACTVQVVYVATCSFIFSWRFGAVLPACCPCSSSPTLQRPTAAAPCL